MDKTTGQKSKVKTQKLGKFKLSLLSGGRFWLDGGAMFGVVPKPLWERLNPSDTHNRIELGLNCLLIETGDKNILVDTGILRIEDIKFNEIYKVEYASIRDALSKLNLTPKDIHLVINSHLHFDHCGGNTYKAGDNYLPSFPCAKYVIQELEWYDATHPNERTRTSYISNTFIPLKESGNLELIKGDVELLPGIRVHLTGGHTRGHQVVLLESNGERGSTSKGIYFADLIPTTSHIRVPYVMGYDLYPLETIAEKKELLELASAERWLVIFEHEPKIGMGYLDKRDGKLVFVPNY